MDRMGRRNRGSLSVWIGAVGLVALIGADVAGPRSRLRSHDTFGRDVVPVEAGEEWLYIDLAYLLGPLVTLDGEGTDPGVGRLRLWIVIEDRECLSCLDELPVLKRLVDQSGFPGIDAVIVALGDRHEARRTLLGLEPGMPISVSTNTSAAAVLDLFEATRTPVRVLTWYGRVVGRSRLSVLEKSGESRFVYMLRRWSTE